MTPPPAPAPVSPATAARILHLGLTMSAVVIAAGAWFFRGTLELPAGTGGALTFAAYALAASGLLAGLAFRRLIPGRSASDSQDAWWKANLPRAVAVWAVGESIVLVGALVYAVGGQLAAATVVALAGFAVLIATAPARLDA
jgi:hypothetical protein